MAKASDVPGLEAEMPFAEAAARTVEVRARELFEHAGGVLDVQDIERVHDMRVASRRLRAVLEIYAGAFPRPALRAVLRDVKALADALGARRDPDVQLAAIAMLEERADPADRPGLEAFADRLRAEQQDGNTVLAGALATAEQHDLRARLAALVAAARETAVRA
jgi:CHAD domain-containing protein